MDHNATTPMHPLVIEMMIKLAERPLNPSSIHAYGREGKAVIERAREQIAELAGIRKIMKDYQITFTSSGTEANNLIMTNFRDGEIFISAVEHASIAVYRQYMTNIKVINVDQNGIIDRLDLEAKLQVSSNLKKLVSVMLANNETGVIQPMQEVTRLAHQYGALVHSDAAQAPGKIPIDMIEPDLDFVSLSAHKFGGPLGAGALIAREKHQLVPVIIGGGQEKNRRSGTENVLAIAGFGKAAEIVKAEQKNRHTKMIELRDRLEKSLITHIPDLTIAGYNTGRLPNTSLLINENKTAETQIIALDLKGIAVSSGAACSSGKVAASSVLKAMGYNEKQAKSAIRVSVGADTTDSEIEQFIKTYITINEYDRAQ